MPDQSELDSRYFVDASVFNCPHCNRRHVVFELDSPVSFDWKVDKPCWVYFAACASCKKRSMHLSYTALHQVDRRTGSGGQTSTSILKRFRHNVDLDEEIFYSVPTSFFSVDSRVPRALRELLTEAEGCLKSNFLTGASACARKIVYELCVLQGASGDNYDERIRYLKESQKEVPGEYFDTLLTIQQVTSTKVHERSYDGWESRHLRLILATLVEVLHELYVLPAIRRERRAEILALRDELVEPAQESRALTEPSTMGPEQADAEQLDS